ncbi:hypothetical protein [Kitasatospora sp. NPDC087314]
MRETTHLRILPRRQPAAWCRLGSQVEKLRVQLSRAEDFAATMEHSA